MHKLHTSVRQSKNISFISSRRNKHYSRLIFLNAQQITLNTTRTNPFIIPPLLTSKLNAKYAQSTAFSPIIQPKWIKRHYNNPNEYSALGRENDALKYEKEKREFTQEYEKLKQEGAEEDDDETWDPWLPPLLGFSVIAALAIWHSYASYKYKKRKQREAADLQEPLTPEEEKVWAKPTVSILKRLPLGMLSHLWGKVTTWHIPEFARGFVFGTFAKIYDCNLDEMSDPVEKYATFAEFFTRKLMKGARTIADDADMISPVDGRVLYFGEVTNNYLEQVKGVRYRMSAFLGKDLHEVVERETLAAINKRYEYVRQKQKLALNQHLPHNDNERINAVQKFNENQQKQLQKAKEELKSSPPAKKLYHCIIYLAPGDYHGFHSPVDWQITDRRHFPGFLFPVAPWLVKRVRGLFALNERVVLAGEWKHGFFSFTPVGATNVGSIQLTFDDVKTNVRPKLPEKYYHRTFTPVVPKNKGDDIGFFYMGSTIVLVFESPEFEFAVEPGQKVKLGEKLGAVKQQPIAPPPQKRFWFF